MKTNSSCTEKTVACALTTALLIAMASASIVSAANFSKTCNPMKINFIKRFITIAAAAILTLACAAGGTFAELKDNNNGTITDTATGLVWLKDANCFGKRDWRWTMSSVSNLSSGGCGLTDKSTAGQWRLPTKVELIARAANKAGFTNIQTDYYWSDSTYSFGAFFGAYAAWIVRMSDGNASNGRESNFYYVWPVRAGQ